VSDGEVEEKTGGGPDPLERLDAILRFGSPEEVLADSGQTMELSDILDLLSEEGGLTHLGELSAMTPAWSLFIRNYLELSHDRFDLDLDLEEGSEPDFREEAVFGVGILLDLDRPLPGKMTLEALGPLARLLETLLTPSGTGAQVFLHPRILSFADLYTFSYDARRGFVEERVTFGFSMDSSGSFDRIPVMTGDTLPGDWDQPSEDLLLPNDPVRKAFGGTLENGRGAIVGVVRLTPPEGEWGEFLDRRFTPEIQEEMGALVGRIFDLTAPFEGGEEDGARDEGQVSLVPWSLLLPMGVTIEMGAFLSERLSDDSSREGRSGSRGQGSKKNQGIAMTPLWREGTLFLDIEGLPSPGNAPVRFPAVDEYVAHFMENYVPEIVESMMGLTVQWNKRKGGGRFLSLGVI